MSKERFAVLLYMMLHKIGIYEFVKDLEPLQMFHEFHSLALRMAGMIKPLLPSDVNYDLLQQGIAMQGLGTYALFVMLSPSLQEESEDNEFVSKQQYIRYNLDDEILQSINYHFHPVISAEIASNWGYDEPVVKLLLEHHNLAYHELSKECAYLKMINRFTDKDFRIAFRENLDDFMCDLPQIDLDKEELFKIVRMMDNLKDNLIQSSSSLICVKSKEAKKVTEERIKSFTGKNVVRRQNVSLSIDLENYDAADFRFEPDYLKALTHECYAMQNSLYERVTSKRENETYKKFGERMETLQAAMDVLATNHDIVAKRMDCDVNELKLRIRNVL
ncbi:MAG: hypothetical protein HQM16_04030 [Deltaproteobacteria bacterium]|nr:hypothetical protein [Deltaproteobacteria bacterium]